MTCEVLAHDAVRGGCAVVGEDDQRKASLDRRRVPHRCHLQTENQGQGRLQGSRVASQLGWLLDELSFALLFPFRIEWAKLQLLRQQMYVVPESHRRGSAGRARRVPDVDLHLSSTSSGLAHARGICDGRPGKVVGKNRAETDSVRPRLQISPQRRAIRVTAGGRAGEDRCCYQRRANRVLAMSTAWVDSLSLILTITHVLVDSLDHG